MRCQFSSWDARTARIRLGLIVFLAMLIGFPLIFFMQAARRIRRFPVEVRQRAMFYALGAAAHLFSNEFDLYPPSDANDLIGVPSCGAMKLAEAIVGQDLLGFHSESVFRVDGLDLDGRKTLYPAEPNEGNLKARCGPYLQAENAYAYRLVDVYGKGHTGLFDEDVLVLCDTYIKMRLSGKETGMPILYYRARTDRTAHDMDDPNNPENIYDYRDNHALVCLGVPGKPNAVHPLSDPKRFYMNTRSDKIATESKPHKADTFILISAGYDGRYGTADDICNFNWKYRE